jgi:hypothetical protein
MSEPFLHAGESRWCGLSPSKQVCGFVRFLSHGDTQSLLSPACSLKCSVSGAHQVWDARLASTGSNPFLTRCGDVNKSQRLDGSMIG